MKTITSLPSVRTCTCTLVSVLLISIFLPLLSCTPPASDPYAVQSRNQKAESLQDVPIQTVHFALNTENNQSTPYELTLQAVAQLPSPMIDGIQVQACDALIYQNQLMVAYNTQGSNHHGAIQWIDLTRSDMPILRYEVLLPHSDVNRIRLYQNRYLIAATGEKDEAARLEIFDLHPEPHWISSINLPSFQANMLMLHGRYALVSSADQGGVSIVDLSDPTQPQWQAYRPMRDVRYVEAISDQELLIVTGGADAMISRQSWPQTIEQATDRPQISPTHHTSLSNHRSNGLASRNQQEFRLADILGDGDVGAPTWGLIQDDHFYLSADRQGVLSFMLHDQGIDLQSQVNTEGDANAVMSSSFGYALLANGQEGLVVMDLSDPSHTRFLAHFDVPGDQGSANAIALRGHQVILADGLGGVKFLRTQLQRQTQGLSISQQQ